MYRSIYIVLTTLLMTIYASHQNYPGTKTRPILSDAEAAQYTKEKYLEGWTPPKIQMSKADYIVGNGHYTYIQEAINAAIKAGGTARKYIHIQKGTYKQVVFIPKSSVPLTIYGTYGKPEDVHIIMSQSASTTSAEWSKHANPNGKVFKNGDPAWSMFKDCQSRVKIGTSCSMVLWAQAHDLEVAYLTVENPSIQAQAVVARLDGDKKHFDHVHLYGFQDTLYLKGTRLYFNKATIKGDVDFIFGPGTAVIEEAQIIGRADRPRTAGTVLAPSTDIGTKYGILVIKSKITADNAIKGQKGLSLARAWDNKSGSNGQLLIRETEIVNVINEIAPYGTSTSKKPFTGNVNKSRNLDDPKFNRFWEYKNTGAGA